MLKNISFLVILCCLVTFAYAQEEITITTYYPSPFGSYRELETETLFFRETTDGLISFHYPDTTYDRRLRITAGLSDTGDNNQGASIDLHGNAAGGRLDLVAGRGGYTSFWTSPAGTAEAERMRITSGGNVGIGTTGPAEKLTLGGGSHTFAIIHNARWDHMRMFHDGATGYLDTGGAESGLAFRVDNTAVGYPAASYTEVMRLVPSGNVGIGTTDPQAKLHIGGTAGVDGIMFPDGSLQKTARPHYLKYTYNIPDDTQGAIVKSGAWRTVLLNEEDNDTGNNGSLSSYQITLDAGTYECSAAIALAGPEKSQCRLRNVNDNTTTVLGLRFEGMSSNDYLGLALLAGRFTIAAQKTFRLQVRVNNDARYGPGGAVAFGESAPCAMIEFRKVD